MNTISKAAKFAYKWLIIISIISGISFIIAGTYFSSYVEAEVLPITVEVEKDLTPGKIEALKKDLVARLMACESAGHKEDDAIIIYDNNAAGTLKGKNVWSIGQLQWKVSSIQHYEKQRSGKQLTQKEAVLIALDTDQAADLALWTIFETKNGIDNWLNCSEKLNLAAEVKIINKLSK